MLRGLDGGLERCHRYSRRPVFGLGLVDDPGQDGRPGAGGEDGERGTLAGCGWFCEVIHCCSPP